MKYDPDLDTVTYNPSRTPHGVRGLKWRRSDAAAPAAESHPARGAWIEMDMTRHTEPTENVAPRTGCVD